MPPSDDDDFFLPYNFIHTILLAKKARKGNFIYTAQNNAKCFTQVTQINNKKSMWNNKKKSSGN